MTERTAERGVVYSEDAGEERTPAQSPSRRRFLSRAAVAGGGVGLLSAGTGTAAAGGSEDDASEETESEENGDEDDAEDAENDVEDAEDVSTVDVLNFALRLEHLEAAYYNDFLEEYSEQEVERSEAAHVFAEPGLRFSTYQRIEEIRDHEEAHVEALTETIEDLGGDPVEPAEYEFPYDSIAAFVDLSATIEAVGVSAYAGAAPLIDEEDEAVVETALSIHSVEARHTAYFRTLDESTPFPNAFDPARTMEEVLEIAAQYIVGETGETNEGSADDSEEANGETGEGSLSLAGLRAATGPGDDPNSEYIEFLNSGEEPLDLTDWVVANGREVTCVLPDGFTLAPSETFRLYSGRGMNTDSALYWGSSREVWNDQFDTLTVRNANDEVVLQRSYP